MPRRGFALNRPLFFASKLKRIMVLQLYHFTGASLIRDDEGTGTMRGQTAMTMRGQTAMARPHPRNRAKFTRQWGHFRLYLRGIMLHSDDGVAEKCGRHFGTTAFRGISGISDGHFGTVWCEPIAPSARNEGKNLTWCQSCQPFPHRSGGFWDKHFLHITAPAEI